MTCASFVVTCPGVDVAVLDVFDALVVVDALVAVEDPEAVFVFAGSWLVKPTLTVGVASVLVWNTVPVVTVTA